MRGPPSIGDATSSTWSQARDEAANHEKDLPSGTWAAQAGLKREDAPTWTDEPPRGSWAPGDMPSRNPWGAGEARGPWDAGEAPPRGPWGSGEAPPRGPWGAARPSEPAADQDWSSMPGAEREMPSGTGAGSRWAQLRNDRTSAPSVWENIRQQSAREALASQGPSSASSSNRADTSRAQKTSYDEAVAEYNKALERERMGIDETTGFDDNTRIR